MAIHVYYQIGEAIRFAQDNNATSILIETDSGNIEYTPDNAARDFADIAPGEAFSVLGISFADED